MPIRITTPSGTEEFEYLDFSAYSDIEIEEVAAAFRQIFNTKQTQEIRDCVKDCFPCQPEN